MWPQLGKDVVKVRILRGDDLRFERGLNPMRRVLKRDRKEEEMQSHTGEKATWREKQR